MTPRSPGLRVRFRRTVRSAMRWAGVRVGRRRGSALVVGLLLVGILAADGPVAVAPVTVAAAAPGDPGPSADDRDLQALFEQGNRLYSADDFAGAADAYRAILEQGVEAPAVYYNLGNASLESGDLGQAVWAYARARKLAPFDPDVEANLTRARALRADAVPADEDHGVLAGLIRLVQRVPLRAAWRGVEILYWVLAGVLLAFVLRPRWRRGLAPAAWALGLLLVVMLGYTGARTAVERSRTTAVVLPVAVEVRSEPDREGKLVFTLHAGSEVRVERRVGGWVEISLGPELKGWVPDPDLAVI